MTEFRSASQPFRPRARLLLLLGDQLIRDPGLAVFELVKNAYDADSPWAKVSMSAPDRPEEGSIVVEDAGVGMDFETVTSVWLEPGTDYRVLQQQEGWRTPVYSRAPLGEKGVGRFAAHKLGDFVRLTTKKAGCPEVEVAIDWTRFEEETYLSELPVQIVERDPVVFPGERTGTRIEAHRLRSAWTQAMARDLARSVNSICSPFDLVVPCASARRQSSEFSTSLVIEDHPEWLEGLLTVGQLLEFALYVGHGEVDGNSLTYDYSFKPYPAMTAVSGREKHVEKVGLGPLSNDALDCFRRYVGRFRLDLHIFDLDPMVLKLGVTDRRGLRGFLSHNGGVRVYREGIRVFDYGEPGNDWLNLGTRRVNVPTRRISNNLVLGAVSLDRSVEEGGTNHSSSLVEKTNREGFVENEAYRLLRLAVARAVEHVVAERNIDKARLRNAYGRNEPREPVLGDLAALRRAVEDKGLASQLGPYLDRIEADFVMIKERFLTSASAGLSLSVVIHEVEKAVAELQRAVVEDAATQRIGQLAKHLADLVEGFGALMRRSGMSMEKAVSLITSACFNTELRLRAHAIDSTIDISQGDFVTKCSRRLTIATLMNLLDNSIYWLDSKWGLDASAGKRIYVGTSRGLGDGPAIVVGDNGPGFLDPHEYLVQPFISRKPDGMGLGLHIAEQVMASQGGRIAFPDAREIDLPEWVDGAVVVLVFGGTSNERA